ncbi:hypothetical protein TCAL_16894 [Tigriopus californicus]|uniref:Sushi domain-containing protein n=1 Tax=Tigriopus californicus TaxID=6832 RepID=A0A553P7Y5_TIGCA|nr:hypothetical protein TCAL_16894 [Tigriopus californicus]
METPQVLENVECPEFHIEDVELESRLESRKIGSIATFSCPLGFVLQGPDKIACQKNGKRACRFPGDPVHGRITPVKFLYEIGDKILVQCHSGFLNTGKQKLQCLESGGWSDRVPKCHNYMGSTR